ncbi:hypothetical protein [Ralstonia solanacearum]|uniref:hypothetical protein n=1 Tax=Ralstonia solanacearum TaxID=305 RepID=UPI0024810940|nr:hypothetical protein [Ralstonia solanacearum]
MATGVYCAEATGRLDNGNVPNMPPTVDVGRGTHLGATVRLECNDPAHSGAPLSRANRFFEQGARMNMLKRRLDATDEKLQELKTARKTAAKVQRQQLKQTRADRERKIILAGEALLRRVDRGEWDEADFRAMMDDYLSRPADRALFELDDE